MAASLPGGLVRLAFILFCACASVPPAPTGPVCGDVHGLTVKADPWNGWVHCPEALDVTREAVSLVGAPDAGVVVFFTYKFIGFDDMTWPIPQTGPYGTIPTEPGPVPAIGHYDPELRIIWVNERHPGAVLWQLVQAQELESP